MKDKSQDPYVPDLRPCPLSVHCLRLVDELDVEEHTPATNHTKPISFEDDQQDTRLVEELRAHLPICPTCTDALAQARHLRTQQRSLLSNLLTEGEQRVPSTIEHILRALRVEAHTQPLRDMVLNSHNHHNSLAPVSLQPEEMSTLPLLPSMPGVKLKELPPFQQGRRPAPRHVRATLRTLVSLAAAALIVLGALAVLVSLVWLRRVPATTTSPHIVMSSTAVQSSKDWTAVVVTSVQRSQLVISVYDPTSGKSASVASVPAASAAFDGVSHDGQKLLYHVYDGAKTVYHLWYLSGNGTASDNTLYTYAGKGGVALFRSPDDQYIFVSTPGGVEQVDSVSGSSSTLLTALRSPVLQFYRNGYLYFLRSSLPARLERANISTGAVQSLTPCQLGNPPWVSPTTVDAVIYYACAGSQDLATVNSDGTHQGLLRANAEPIVGYDANNAILALSRSNNGAFTILRYSADSSQDQVLIADVTPGAQTLPPTNVAVAPYGHTLVAKGMYADGQTQTWFGDLIEGTVHKVSIPGDAASLALPGWARLQVSPTARPTAQTGPNNSYSNWHGVVVVTRDPQTGLTHIVNYDTRNGVSTPITSNALPLNTIVDGVSHNGLNVLYHYASGGKTLYWTIAPLAATGYFYALDDNDAGNAVWMPDNRNVLITTLQHGLLKVDITTGVATNVLPALKVGKLVVYRDPDLYFVGAENLATGALYRVNLADGVPHQITLRTLDSTFWLSPDGSMVYYVNKGAAGQAGLYVVRSDGTDPSLLRGDGVPIGYAASTALTIVRNVNGTFRIVKLGAQTEQDQTLLDNVVPGAVSLCDTAVPPGIVPICDHSVALAPLGAALVVEATYPDNTHKLWSIDLQTGQRLQLPLASDQPDLQIQLIGWDQITG